MFDEFGNQVDEASVHDPRYQQRLTYFNMARRLFPYTTSIDALPVKVEDVIKAAKTIETFLTSEA